MSHKKIYRIGCLFVFLGLFSNGYAGGEKIGKSIITVISPTATRQLVKQSVSGLPKRLPAIDVNSLVRQKSIAANKTVGLPEYSVQLEFPFSRESIIPADVVARAVAQKLSVRLPVSQEDIQLLLPSGESVRFVKLRPQHFKKSYTLKNLIRYFKAITTNPVVLYIKQTGEKVTVFKNDKLRYLEDLKQVFPEGSYLLLYENGTNRILLPEEVSVSLENAYKQMYEALHPSEEPYIAVLDEDSYTPQILRVSSLSDLFSQKESTVWLFNLSRHPLYNRPVQVAVLKQKTQVYGLSDLPQETTLVRYSDGTFDIHLAGQVPPILQVSLERNATDKVSVITPLPFKTSELAQRVYSNSTDLAKDLKRLEKGRSYILSQYEGIVAYEIPEGIFYQPEGKEPVRLDPVCQVLIYYPSYGIGKIVERSILEEAISSFSK